MPRAANTTRLRMRLFCEVTFWSSKAGSANGSAAVDQQSKRPRNRGWLRLGLLRSRSGSRGKIRGVNEKSVCLGIERHVASPKFSLNGLNYGEFVGSVFMEDVQSAFARGGEKQSCFRLKNVRVYSITDGKRLKNLAAVSIHDGKHLVAAADEEAAMLDVHFHGGGPCGWSDRPVRLDGIRAGIQDDDLVFILDIVVNHPLAISHGVLGAAAHWNIGYNGLCGRVYHSGVVAFAIHREDMFGGGIVKDAVWIAASLDVPGNFQGLQIENNGFVGATVADETAAKIRDESDPMDPFQIRNTADDRATVSIHNFHFRVVRDVKTTRGSIERDVVPVFFSARGSAEFIFLQQMETALRGTCEGKTAEHQYGTAQSEAMQNRKLHVESSAECLIRTIDLLLYGTAMLRMFLPALRPQIARNETRQSGAGPAQGCSS